ncbi:glycosyltransferase [candidate division KSB1 bacterium]|nr:glycosyltransferase [candidate division KSB1 bacterium]
MDRIDRNIGICALVVSGICLGWMITHVVDPLGWIIVIADGSLFVLLGLYIRNHTRQLHRNNSYESPEGSLDVFLPVVNEPLDLFERTLRAAYYIEYPKTIYVLDDGPRAAIRRLSVKYKVHYLCRNSNKDYKAGNLNYGLLFSKGDFILVLDADQIVEPDIAQNLMGHFSYDECIAVVSTRQRFDVPENDFNQEHVFYSQMQPGKNADNAAISCGSGVFYRRKALHQIGGFATWNLVEDVTTTYVLHKHGFVSVYVDKPYSIGTAPCDPKSIFKQRMLWAIDTLRLFWFSNPLLTRLSAAQKCHYFEMGWAYLCAGFFLPLLFILLPVSYLFDFDYFDPNIIFLVLKGAALFFTLFFLHRQCRGQWQAFRYWVALFPAYFIAFYRSLWYKRPNYVVTEKRRIKCTGIFYAVPHIFLLASSASSLVWYIYAAGYGMDEKACIGIFWTASMLFWFLPFIKRVFYKNRIV